MEVTRTALAPDAMLRRAMSVSSVLASSSSALKLALPCAIIAAVLGWVVATLLKLQQELALLRILVKQSVRDVGHPEATSESRATPDEPDEEEERYASPPRTAAASNFARFAASMRASTHVGAAAHDTSGRIEDITDDGQASEDMSDIDDGPPAPPAAPPPTETRAPRNKKKKASPKRHAMSSKESEAGVAEEVDGDEEGPP